MKQTCIAALMLTVLGLTGCTAQPRGHLVDPLQAQTVGYGLTWAADLALSRSAEPAVYALLGDIVVVLEPSARLVTVVSVTDGRVRWTQRVGRNQDRLIAAQLWGADILVVADTQVFVLDNERGVVKNSSMLEEVVKTGPVVAGDYAIFGGVNGKVFAHDVVSGYSKWGCKLSDAIEVQPVLFSAQVFAADRRGVMVMLTAANGEVQWKRQPAPSITGQPAISNLGVFVPTQDNKLYCLNRASGKDRWIYRATLGMPMGPVVLGNVVYQPLAGGQWVAIDAVIGPDHPLWAEPAKGAFHSLVRVPQGLLAASAKGLTLLDPQTGKALKQVSTLPTRLMLAGPNDSLILISPQGRLLRLDPLP